LLVDESGLELPHGTWRRYVSSRTKDNQSLRAMEGGNLNTYVDMGSHRVNNLALVKPDIF